VGRVAADEPAVNEQPRLGTPAAFGQRLGAIALHMAAVEDALDERMQLEALERRMRIEQWILVVAAGDESDRDVPFGHRIQKTPAEFLLTKGIAKRMDHRAWLEPAGGHLPQFLQANRKLWLTRVFVVEIERSCELFRQVPANTFGKDGDLGANVGAGLERALRLAVLADAAIARAHAGHA